MSSFQKRIASLKTQKAAADAARLVSFWLWLSPSKKKGETEKTTVVRMVYKPDNEFGQTDPLLRFGLHENLSRINPQTGCRPYPGMNVSTKTVPCLNVLAEELLGPGEHDWCEPCRDEPVLRAEKKTLDAMDNTKLSREYGMFFNDFKAIPYVGFVAIRRTSPMMVQAAGGDYAKAGMIPVNAKRKVVAVDSPEIKAWCDPIYLVKIKEYFCDGDGGNFYNMLAEREMTKSEYETKVGRLLSAEEFLSECPPKREADPFDPVNGWAFEIYVHGQSFKRKMEFTACKPQPLTKKDKVIISQKYPNIVKEITPEGMSRVIPINDETWRPHFSQILEARKQSISMYPSDDEQCHAYYTLTVLSEAQREQLGVNHAPAILLPNQATAEAKHAAAQQTASQEDDGDLNYGLEDGDIDDDIPF